MFHPFASRSRSAIAETTAGSSTGSCHNKAHYRHDIDDAYQELSSELERIEKKLLSKPAQDLTDVIAKLRYTLFWQDGNEDPALVSAIADLERLAK